MTYIPPSHNEIDFSLKSSYSPPVSSNIDFDGLDEAGSSIASNVNIALSSEVVAFSESYQVIDGAFLLNSSVEVESGTKMDVSGEFSLGSEVETFSEGLLEVPASFTLSALSYIGVQSYADPISTFGLGCEVTAASVTPIDVVSNFALSATSEISVKGEPLHDVSATFLLRTTADIVTHRNDISAGFALGNTVGIESDNTFITLNTMFALGSDVDTFFVNQVSIDATFSLEPSVVINTPVDCSLPTHDSGRWT